MSAPSKISKRFSRRCSALASRRTTATKRRYPSPASSSEAVVAEKLESLRSLIPGRKEDAGDDRLFEETADYIIRLRAQAVALQGLIHLYGSDDCPAAVSTALL